MDGTEVLIKEGEAQEIEIQGTTFRIGKLSFFQTVALLKWIGKVAVIFKDAFKAKVADESSAQEDVLNIFSVIDEKFVTEFVIIALTGKGNPPVDEDFCRGIDLEELTGLIANLLEVNNWTKILKNVQRATAVVNRITETLNATK
jgi:hypothetical protein